MKARLVHEIGTRAWLRVRWGSGCSGPRSYHRAERHLADSARLDDAEIGADASAIAPARWPAACDDCGAPAPVDAVREVIRRRLYDTASGQPEPGDLYWADWFGCDARGGRCIHGWTNCDGAHLMAVLPSGEVFDIDGRAFNCTRPEDTVHRCWVRHGSPPAVTVDKNGLTCGAGGGSIAAADYHGFLVGGEFRDSRG